MQGAVLEHDPAGVVEGRLQLGPHLAGDLLTGALLRGPAVQDAGPVPLRDVHRDAVHGHAVPVVGREVTVGPVPGLLNRRQGPRGVDAVEMSVDQRRALRQIELDARHPVGLQPVASRQLRVRGTEPGAPGPARVLHGDRGDVVVGGHRPAHALRVLDHRGGDLPGAVRHVPDGPAHPELHAETGEMLHPRVDPGLVRGGVEDPVERSVGAPAQRVEGESLEERGDRTRTGLLGLGGDDVPGEPDGEDALVVVAHPAGPDEVPPGRGLPGGVPALGAAGEEDQTPVDEVRGLQRRDAQRGVQQGGERAADFVQGEIGGLVPRPGERDPEILTAGARERHLGGATRLSHTPFGLPGKGMRRIVSGRL